MKFGDIFITHGSFQPGQVQGGNTYLAIEELDSDRITGFQDYGKFNLIRILPNIIWYLFTPITGQWFDDITFSFTGYIRREFSIGIAFMWLPWLVIIGLNSYKKNYMVKWSPLIIGMALCALLTLCYATRTLRYQFDLWPIIFIMALIGIQVLYNVIEKKRKLIIFITYLSILITLLAAMISAGFARIDSIDDHFPESQCHDILNDKGFEIDKVHDKCRYS